MVWLGLVIMIINRTYHARRWFLRTALSYLGTPYIWGGDDPSGFDCSGFVVECLKTAGLMGEHEDMTAHALMKHFSQHTIQQPCAGALLFTVNTSGRATHVVICLDAYFQIGASGGTSFTTSRKKAWRDNAYIKIRPIRLRDLSHRLCDPFLG